MRSAEIKFINRHGKQFINSFASNTVSEQDSIK